MFPWTFIQRSSSLIELLEMEFNREKSGEYEGLSGLDQF